MRVKGGWFMVRSHGDPDHRHMAGTGLFPRTSWLPKTRARAAATDSALVIHITEETLLRSPVSKVGKVARGSGD